MIEPRNLPPELLYVVLIFLLFVVPRLFQRLRLPAAITSLILGGAAAHIVPSAAHDHTVGLLATFGITGLFLLAGLDVDLPELRRSYRPILLHLALRMALLVGGAWLGQTLLRLPPGAAWPVALALFTPSTGFILDSIDLFGLNPEERSSVKSMAIASELLALFVLFIVLQSNTASNLALASLALLGIIVVLPMLFWMFARWVAPHAPKSEFAFLLMTAVVCAFATRRLGVYYLVGAFLVGMAAQAFRRRLPVITSRPMLYAVEVFASFFAPFYFFNAGAHIKASDIGPESFVVAGVFALVAIPAQYVIVALSRRRQPSRWRFVTPVGLALLPTLVFSLVVTGILRERFDIPSPLFGGLILYTLLTTLIPGFVLQVPRERWEELAMPGPTAESDGESEGTVG